MATHRWNFAKSRCCYKLVGKPRNSSLYPITKHGPIDQVLLRQLVSFNSTPYLDFTSRRMTFPMRNTSKWQRKCRLSRNQEIDPFILEPTNPAPFLKNIHARAAFLGGAVDRWSALMYRYLMEIESTASHLRRKSEVPISYLAGAYLEYFKRVYNRKKYIDFAQTQSLGVRLSFNSAPLRFFVDFARDILPIYLVLEEGV